jgi:AcrR family transcriptional regulator
MSNREDLLEGAKRCLYEKGFARTTARDIASAAGGVSLAAIGYHFGSKEALLNAAMIEAIDEWGEELEGILATDIEADSDPMERFESIWTRVIDSFDAHRPLWVASFEAFAPAQHSLELREQLADGQEEGRFGLAALFQRIDESTVDERSARTVGSFYLALLSGLMVQWLVDPERAPSGRDMAEALRTILASVRPAEKAGDERE